MPDQDDVKQLLSRFERRPRKYAGQELTLSVKFGPPVFGVAEADCVAVGLAPGDAVHTPVHVGHIGGQIYADGEMADWLEGLETSEEHTVRVRLMYGTREGIPDIDGHSETIGISGLRLIGVVSDQPDHDGV